MRGRPGESADTLRPGVVQIGDNLVVVRLHRSALFASRFAVTV